ncbi:MAG: hypothetical protein NT076_02000 [Candidatus Pacearchaeota archaeon]|nr:hypothetical protein [Candidatus Pacearchaeota archaeon]
MRRGIKNRLRILGRNMRINDYEFMKRLQVAGEVTGVGLAAISASLRATTPVLVGVCCYAAAKILGYVGDQKYRQAFEDELTMGPETRR